MANAAKACVGLCALGLVLATVVALTGPIMDLPAETFSRASTNLGVLALCLFVGFKDGGSAG